MYDVLQVSPWCEPEVIQAAFRALARTRHPDVNRDPDAEEQMRRLNLAHETLSDPVRRARYDEELALETARSLVPVRTPAPAPTPRATPSPRPTPTPRPAPTVAWSAPGASSNGHAGPTFRQAGTTTGYASRASAAGPRPAASTVSVGAATASASAAPVYQTTIFDTRGEMMMPRSALYLALLTVVAIVALVTWLVLDTLAQRPGSPLRLPPTYDEMRSGHLPTSPWQYEPLGGSAEPGLSLSDDRWRR